MKEKKQGNITNVGIAISILGIIASVAVIVINVIDGTSKTVGIVLLCACALGLINNVNIKRNNDFIQKTSGNRKRLPEAEIIFAYFAMRVLTVDFAEFAAVLLWIATTR